MTKKTDAVAKLDELEQARTEARQAEREAREDQQNRARAVTEAQRTLSGAYSTGEGVKEAESALQAAQARAADATVSAKIEGLSQATRRADAAVQQHITDNLRELVEAQRPRAEQAVAAIRARAEELDRALLEWNATADAVTGIAGTQQWFRQGRGHVPSSDRFSKVRRELSALLTGDIPLPMPTSLESPAEEAERLEREQEAEREAAHARRTSRAAA